MRIGVDASSWFNGRGYGRFTRELLGALFALPGEHEYQCFVDRRDAPRLAFANGSVSVLGVALGGRPAEEAKTGGSRSPLDLLRLTRAVARARPDVFFCPTVYSYFPLPPRLPSVVTVHDCIAERFPELTLPGRRDRLFWRLKVRLALAQARRVLTVSDYSARDLTAVLGVDPARVRVAVEAPAAAFRPNPDRGAVAEAAARHGLAPGTPYFVYAGGFSPHKGVVELVRAHGALAGAGGEPPHLVLVGDAEGDVFHGNAAEIREAVRAAGSGERVHWTGYVTDEELALLYAGALALVLVSRAEGFGLPAVEAAACGTPVVATRESPLPELLEGAGLFLEPGDEAALGAALGRLAGDPDERRRMGRAARERAAALSWPRAAAAALAAIEEAAG